MKPEFKIKVPDRYMQSLQVIFWRKLALKLLLLYPEYLLKKLDGSLIKMDKDKQLKCNINTESMRCDNCRYGTSYIEDIECMIMGYHNDNDFYCKDFEPKEND